MSFLFYISSMVAIAATLMVITRYHPMHALLYLVVSFLAVALIFLSLGAPVVAALEVMLYAGAIIVLLIFVVMMLNLGRDTALKEKKGLALKYWLGPVLLALVLLIELVLLLLKIPGVEIGQPVVSVKQVSVSMFSTYVIAVELAGFLMTAGIVGAAHIGKHKKRVHHRFLQEEKDESVAGSLNEQVQ